jgi:hypothetical protein
MSSSSSSSSSSYVSSLGTSTTTTYPTLRGGANWDDCAEYPDLAVASKLACYLGIMKEDVSQTLTENFNSLVTSINGFTTTLGNLPRQIWDSFTDIVGEYLANYGITGENIRTFNTYLWTIIKLIYALIIFLLAFALIVPFIIFFIVEGFFIILAFGNKSSSAWNQLNKFIKYNLQLTYFSYKTVHQIFNYGYSLLSLIRGGGTTGT